MQIDSKSERKETYVEQLPHDRYSFPKSWTQYESIFTEPVRIQVSKAIHTDFEGVLVLTAPVVLDDLVARSLGSASDDVRSPGRLLDGNRVLAHVLEPDIGEVARSEAMDAFGLVRSDHDVSRDVCVSLGELYGKGEDVLEGGSGLEDKDSIFVAAFRLSTAGASATVVANVLAW
jgi:hypothetical protein